MNGNGWFQNVRYIAEISKFHLDQNYVIQIKTEILVTHLTLWYFHSELKHAVTEGSVHGNLSKLICNSDHTAIMPRQLFCPRPFVRQCPFLCFATQSCSFILFHCFADNTLAGKYLLRDFHVFFFLRHPTTLLFACFLWNALSVGSKTVAS